MSPLVFDVRHTGRANRSYPVEVPYSSTHFYVPVGTGSIEPMIDTAANHCPHIIREAFKSNLRSADYMMGLPFYLTVESLLNDRWKREYQIRCIEARVPMLPPDDSERLSKQITAEMNEAAKTWKIPHQEALDVLEHRRDKTQLVGLAAPELLRQGLIALWGAFEVLAQDLFAAALDARPALISRLAQDDDAKKFFDFSRSVRFHELLRNEFNISGKMGTLLVEQKSIDTVPAMKTVFFALCSNARELRTALGARELYVLNQRRNLIVHRRGVIDDDFYRLVSEDGVVGSRLTLAGDDLEKAMELVRDSGSHLLAAMSSECFAPAT